LIGVQTTWTKEIEQERARVGDVWTWLCSQILQSVSGDTGSDHINHRVREAWRPSMNKDGCKRNVRGGEAQIITTKKSYGKVD